jgi:hypothetical protein
MKNFFRKDLKLQDKWWHRLIISIYFVFLTVFIIGSLVIFYDAYNRPSLKNVYYNNTSRHPLDDVYGVAGQGLRPSLDSIYGTANSEVLQKNQQDEWQQSMTDVGMPNIPKKEPNPVYQKLKVPVEGFILGLFIFLLMIIFYYKIILYIVFGSKN